MNCRKLIVLIGLLFFAAACASDAASPDDAIGVEPQMVMETPAQIDAASAPTGAPAATPTLPALEPATATAAPTATPTNTPLPASATISAPVSVTRLPDPAGAAWQPFVSGLEAPVTLTFAGDPRRAFVVEQPGRIRMVENGQVDPEPFSDISAQVSYVSERGLLGLAFHPQYPDPPYFYINYTDLNGDTVVERYQVQPDNPRRADPNSGEQILFVDQPYANHNGGHMLFGPDGLLYIGLGDGGSAGDPENNAQNTQILLGSLLRIDVDGEFPYGIPADNPFVNGGGAPEIWAYGLRNPWRFFFDSLTSDLYIGDVGQNNWEEINFLPAKAGRGANFGWDYYEGTHPYDGAPPADAILVMPVAEYDHSAGCSVTGGVVYRGQALPDWQGVYLYGDYCTGTVWGLLRDANGAWQNAPLFANQGRITSFSVDPTGEVYLIDHHGTIFRLANQ